MTKKEYYTLLQIRKFYNKPVRKYIYLKKTRSGKYHVYIHEPKEKAHRLTYEPQTLTGLKNLYISLNKIYSMARKK